MPSRRKFHFFYMILALMTGLGLGGILGASAVYFYKTFPPRAHTHLNVLAYSMAVPQNLADKFLNEKKIQIQQTIALSYSELLEKLNDRAHNYDLVVLMSWQIPTLVASQVLSPIHKNRLTNVHYVAADFKHLPHDKDLIYSVPFGWGVNGLVYNKRKILNHPNSWSAILKEKTYEGKIAFLPEPRELMAGLIRRHQVHSQPLEDSNTNTYIKVFEQVLPMAKNSPQKILKQLGQGEIWAAELSNGMASPLMAHSDDFEFVIPEESATLWTVSLAICRGSNKIKEANQFIDYILSKESALELTRSHLLASPLIVLEYENIHPNLKPSFIRSLPLNRLQVIEPISQMAKQWESTVIEKTRPLN